MPSLEFSDYRSPAALLADLGVTVGGKFTVNGLIHEVTAIGKLKALVRRAFQDGSYGDEVAFETLKPGWTYAKLEPIPKIEVYHSPELGSPVFVRVDGVTHTRLDPTAEASNQRGYDPEEHLMLRVHGANAIRAKMEEKFRENHPS
jgi:hypothetical protein